SRPDRLSSGGDSLARHEDPEGGDCEPDADDQGGVDVVRRGRVAEEQGEADAEADQAGDRQRSVRRRVQVDHEQRDAEHDQGEAGPADGRIENPNKAMVSETAPIAPGRTTPGCRTSKTSPAIPARKRIAIRFGSISVFRKRVKKPGETVVICAPAR